MLPGCKFTMNYAPHCLNFPEILMVVFFKKINGFFRITQALGKIYSAAGRIASALGIHAMQKRILWDRCFFDES